MSRPGTGSRSSRRPDPRPARVRPTQVRDDPAHPDPAFADLYAALPEAHDLWPWLDWGLDAEPPVLYLGIGAGRLAAPLSRAGIELVGIDAHPRMLEHIRRRIPGIELHQTLIADMALGPRFDLGFDLIVGPSSILTSDENLAAAVRHLRPGGRIGMELMNPSWLGSAKHDGVRLKVDGTLEVDYRLPDGSVVVQVVENWSPGPAPGDAKDRLERFGLDLLWLGGRPDSTLKTSPTYYVLAGLRQQGRRSATIDSDGPSVRSRRDRNPAARGRRAPGH